MLEGFMVEESLGTLLSYLLSIYAHQVLLHSARLH